MTLGMLELHMMQLTHFFITKKGYQNIQITGKENEIWLFNTKVREYPFIRIAAGTYQEEDITMIMQVKPALEKILNISGNVFSIYLDTKSYELALTDGIKIIGIDTENYYDLVIDRYFPETRNLFKRVDNIEDEYQKCRRELEEALIQRQKKQVSKRIREGLPWVSLSMALLCILIWAGVTFLSKIYGSNSETPASIVLGAYYRMFIVSNHEYWRFLTAGFVHIDFLHLLMNILSLFNVGIVVEKFYGRWKYALIVLGSIVMGTAFAHFDPSTVVVMGLSGGVYGAFAGLLVILFQTKAIKNPRIMRSVGNVIVLNLLINFLPGVSKMGHLGGFLGGLVLSILLLPGKDGSLLRRNMAVASVVLAVFMGYKLATTRPRMELYGWTDAKVIEMYYQAGLKNYAFRLYQGVNRVYAEELQ